MTAIEDRLAEIEARYTPSEIVPGGTLGREIITFRSGEIGFVLADGWARAGADVRVLAAALRAVLGLIEETRLPAPDLSILGGRVSATRLYAAIARELTP